MFLLTYYGFLDDWLKILQNRIEIYQIQNSCKKEKMMMKERFDLIGKEGPLKPKERYGMTRVAEKHINTVSA